MLCYSRTTTMVPLMDLVQEMVLVLELILILLHTILIENKTKFEIQLDEDLVKWA